MWDRLRQKDGGGGSPLNRKKLESWQKAHSSSPSPTSLSPAGSGIKGGSSQYQYAIRGGPAPQQRPQRPQRPPRDVDYPPEHNQSYLAAPPVQASAARTSYRNSSYGRPVSSVYSQPSPEAATFAAQQLRNEAARNDPNEISPPSSPDIASARNGPNPGDVSPIDEIPDMSQLATDRRGPTAKNDARSNIPMMRRQRRKNSDAAVNALRESKSRDRLKQPRPFGNDVRWDPNTGEPTTSNKGRPSQIDPHEFVQTIGNRSTSASPSQVKNSQPNPKSFGDRLRRTRQPSDSPRPEPEPEPEPRPASRPEWRGASGRTTLVAPVNDSKSVKPLTEIPRRSSKRGAHGPAVLSPVNSVNSETSSTPAARGPGLEGGSDSRNGSTFGKIGPSGQQPQSPLAANVTSSTNTPAYPSPPLSDDNSVPAKRAPAQQRIQARPQPSSPQPLHPLQIPSNDKATRRKPAGAAAGHQPEKSTSSSIYSQQHDIHPSQAPPGTFPDEWTQPPSRFSVTTYATSHNGDTPRDSIDVDAPPVPTPPRQFTQQQQQQPHQPAQPTGNSILDRKRPTISGYEHTPRHSPTAEAVKINMDSPYYATSPTTKPRPVPAGNHSTTSVVSVSAAAPTTDKSLPPAPEETQSQGQDRVAQLNARLKALANRRLNINTAIRQMTQLMPTDNVLASDAVVRKREAEKRKVEVLRDELADVERESYELGLKLHRAYKRMDRDAEYEPTTLWVRRVTG